MERNSYGVWEPSGLRRPTSRIMSYGLHCTPVRNAEDYNNSRGCIQFQFTPKLLLLLRISSCSSLIYMYIFILAWLWWFSNGNVSFGTVEYRGWRTEAQKMWGKKQYEKIFVFVYTEVIFLTEKKLRHWRENFLKVFYFRNSFSFSSDSRMSLEMFDPSTFSVFCSFGHFQ